MTIPERDVITLHKKYAPSDSVYDLVFTHCRIIRDIALELFDINHILGDRKAVETGALLHDIGVYPLFEASGELRPEAQYITHGLEGERILREEGLPKSIWRFAAHHTGVGLTKDDITRQHLALPVADYLAQTTEELLIMYADKFHSKTTPPYFNSYEWYRAVVARFGEDKVRAFDDMAAVFGKPDLTRLSHRYSFDIR